MNILCGRKAFLASDLLVCVGRIEPMNMFCLVNLVAHGQNLTIRYDVIHCDISFSLCPSRSLYREHTFCLLGRFMAIGIGFYWYFIGQVIYIGGKGI